MAGALDPRGLRLGRGDLGNFASLGPSETAVRERGVECRQRTQATCQQDELLCLSGRQIEFDLGVLDDVRVSPLGVLPGLQKLQEQDGQGIFAGLLRTPGVG